MSGPGDPIRDDVQGVLASRLPVVQPLAQFLPAEDTLLVALPGGYRARVATSTLVQLCAREPPQDWPGIVDRWLRYVAEQAGAVAEARSQVADASLSISREQLRLRVVPTVGGELARRMAVVPFGGHFDALIVADHPGRVELLTREQVARLGLDEDVRQVAVNNTVWNVLQVLDVRDHPVTATESVRMLAMDGNPYVSSALLTVERFLPGPVPDGALVAVPSYSAVLLHPVTSDAALDFVIAFAEMTRAMFDTGPYPCTPEVYWWLDGTFHHVRITPTEDPHRRRVNLPETLEPVVQQLPRQPR